MIPKVSVVVPCYNQGKYLSETLDSLLAQTLQEWECVVVDDGSTDDSSNIAKTYAQQDQRIRYIYQENAGPSTARNKGVGLTKASLIFFLDGDDLIAPDFLKLGVDYMNAHPRCTLFYAGTEYFGSIQGEFKLHYTSYRDLLVGNSIVCASIVRRDDFNRVGGFDELLRGYEDWEFFIRLLYHNDIVYKNPLHLFFYRMSDNSNSVNREAKLHNKEKTMYVYQKHISKYEEFYGTPFHIVCEYNRLEKELSGLFKSKTYKLGQFLLCPFKKIFS